MVLPIARHPSSPQVLITNVTSEYAGRVASTSPLLTDADKAAGDETELSITYASTEATDTPPTVTL